MLIVTLSYCQAKIVRQEAMNIESNYDKKRKQAVVAQKMWVSLTKGPRSIDLHLTFSSAPSYHSQRKVRANQQVPTADLTDARAAPATTL
jgi:hypothetical protein